MACSKSMQRLDPEEFLRRKLSRGHPWYLQLPCSVEYEYVGRLGHPSSYGLVKFECEPQPELSFKSSAEWPESVGGPTSVRTIEDFIAEGVVDGLVSGSSTPYSGVGLNLVAVRFDDVNSDAHAYYKATKGAMTELIRVGKWGLSPPKTPGS